MKIELSAIADRAGGTSKTKFCCTTKPLVLFVRRKTGTEGGRAPCGLALRVHPALKKVVAPD